MTNRDVHTAPEGHLDAHHHLWVLADHPQTWMDPATDRPIMRDFTAADLAEATSTAGIAATIVVQSVHDVTETQALLATAADSALIRGVVGWADLTASDLADQIALWREGPGGKRLVGLRHLVHDEPDPDWLDRPEVRRGLGTLAQVGLSFDLLVRSPQLPAATRVARALPELRLVVDHLAKPPLTHVLGEWATALHTIAAEPNVSAKISGLVTEADWRHWAPADLAPAVDIALESFGPERLMFGSDWPVCLLASTYADVVQVSEQLLGRLSAYERHRIFATNARAFYRLT